MNLLLARLSCFLMSPWLFLFVFIMSFVDSFKITVNSTTLQFNPEPYAVTVMVLILLNTGWELYKHKQKENLNETK